MASIVTIAVPSARAQCDAQGKAEFAFTVTNSSGMRLRVASKILPESPAREEWFTIDRPERELAENETDQITVKAHVPTGVTGGAHRLKLLVFSAERGRSGEDFTEGPTVVLEVPGGTPVSPAPGNSGFPWWVAVVTALVLLLGGAATWWFWPRAVEVPLLTHLSRAQAERKLQDAGLALGDVQTERTGTVADDIILGQDPPGGTKVEKGSAVSLTVEAASIRVPNVVNLPYGQASVEIESKGLKAVRSETRKECAPPGQELVVSQSPGALSLVEPGSTVTMNVVIPADLPYGPDTCKQGYVWRDAFAGDHVCVTPEVREQARNDNKQAAERVQPGGGAYGPDTCKQGFVWREASPTDHVCVTSDVRSQAKSDNSQANKRRACPQ